LCAAALVLAAMLPIALAGAAQAYVYLEVPDLPWVSLAWRARGVPVFISFAFWEWITCLVLSAYMVALAVTTARLKAA
jgi:Na+/proline symporter